VSEIPIGECLDCGATIFRAWAVEHFEIAHNYVEFEHGAVEGMPADGAD
jgi:hypothetical protein